MTRSCCLLLVLFVSFGAGYAQDNTVKIVYEHASMKGRFKTRVEVLVKDQAAQTHYHRSADKKVEDNVTYSMNEAHYITHYDMARRHFSEQRTFDGMKAVADWPLDTEWTITEETRTIAGYAARKATAASEMVYLVNNERIVQPGEVEAWFTPDIPLGTGPNRLGGLPGLILEVRYTNQSDVYTFESIAYDTSDTLADISQGYRVEKDDLLNFEVNNTARRVKKAYKKGFAH